MNKFARIQNNIVAEVIHAPDITGMFHPNLQWVPCGEEVQVGWRYGEEGFSPEISSTPTLEQVKAAAIARINREAGEERGRHITVAPGQSATYLEKQDEGRRYARGEFGPFPYLQAEATATGQELAEVAALVNATAAAWTAVNAAIEGRRRGALVAVDKAVMVSQVDEIFPIAWPEG